jgi:hypothetical protein
MFIFIRAIFLFCFWVGLYMLPTILVYRQKQRDPASDKSLRVVFFINFFLGWTLYGWWVAMQMAMGQIPTHKNQRMAAGAGGYAGAAGGSAAQSFESGSQSRPCYSCGGSGTTVCSSCQGRGSWYTQPQTAHESSRLETCGACTSSGRLRCMGCGGSGRA